MRKTDSILSRWSFSKQPKRCISFLSFFILLLVLICLVYQHQTQLNTPLLRVNSDLISSKLFQSIHKPSERIPYYFESNYAAHPEDITLTTIATMDRLDVLLHTAQLYSGPVSIAFHIPKEYEDLHKRMLSDWIQTHHTLVSKNLDFHLIIDLYPRQFNYWRNVARLYAKTNYVLMLDADFMVMSDVRFHVLNNPEWMKMLRDGSGALILPAMEFIPPQHTLSVNEFPKTKQQVKLHVERGELETFHGQKNPGHAATNFSRWIHSDTAYKVEWNNLNYEPYGIYNRLTAPWCDERFYGYGRNKAACWFEMYLSGIDSFVLPQDFVIHVYHDYPQSERSKERRINRPFFEAFRQEICQRYATQQTLSPEKMHKRLKRFGCKRNMTFIEE